MTRIAIYSRSDYDVDMFRDLIAAARQQNCIVCRYEDEASGEETPELNSLLESVRCHTVDKIITPRLDFIGNSIIGIAEVLTLLKDNNVEIELMEGSMNIESILQAAEFEKRLTKNRINSGIVKAKRNGKVCGRPKKELSDNQRKKIKEILKEEPDISINKLASYFDGISRNTLIRLMKVEGLI